METGYISTSLSCTELKQVRQLTGRSTRRAHVDIRTENVCVQDDFNVLGKDRGDHLILSLWHRGLISEVCEHLEAFEEDDNVSWRPRVLGVSWLEVGVRGSCPRRYPVHVVQLRTEVGLLREQIVDGADPFYGCKDDENKPACL